MNQSSFDAAREVERLQKLHGNLVIEAAYRRVRNRKWVVLASVAVFMIALLLLAVARSGLNSVDRTDRVLGAAKRSSPETRSRLRAELQRLAAEERVAAADVERADVAFAAAKEQLDQARNSNAPARVIRKFELEEKAAAADKDIRAAERAARGESVRLKRMEWLAAVYDAETAFEERPLLSRAFADSSSSAHALAMRGQRLGSHVLAVIGVLCLLGGFCIALIPWVQQRAAALAEDLVKGTVTPVGGATIPGTGPLSVFTTPVRPFFSGGEAGSMGRLALQTVAASSAVALTVGAFSLAIPGRSIDVALEERRTANAAVDVGTFGIAIPGKEFQVSPDRVVLRHGQARVDVPELAFHLPPIEVTRNDDSFRAFARELRAYRTYLQEVQRTTDQTTALQRAHDSEMFALYDSLVMELRDRPTKTEFEALKKRVDDESKTSKTLEKAVHDLKEASVDLHKGSYLEALELARTINSENDRLFNTLFRQTLIQQNCATYEWLHEKFPDLIAPKGCIQRRRLDPIVNPWWQAPLPFQTPPSRLTNNSGPPDPAPVATAEGKTQP
jgi:hypothetical protein